MNLLRISDTIVAPATPAGRSALAVVRLSGERAIEIAARMTGSTDGEGFEHRRVYHTTVTDPATGERIDDCVTSVFRAPHSYTGEDIVELSVHGNPLIVEEVVRIACALGARIAGPGEFTQRAFVNGKLDLIRAEAVADIIEAGSLKGVALARRQAEGGLSGHVARLREALVELISLVEYALDFDDEELTVETRVDIVAKLNSLIASVESILASYRRGRMIREGIRIAIVGRPNVGKSTLFNRLCETERAIVSEHPGTTRDYIEHPTEIGGYRIIFVDTAGIRETDDHVERIGVGLALDRISTADICIVVFDAVRGITPEDRDIIEKVGAIPKLVVGNKADLIAAVVSDANLSSNISNTAIRHPFEGEGPSPDENRKENKMDARLRGHDGKENSAGPILDSAILCSAKTGTGFETLTAEIVARTVEAEPIRSEETIDNARHFDIFRRVLDHAVAARDSLSARDYLDKSCFELEEANRLFGELTGEIEVEEIVERIFSTFCVGK